MAKIKFIAVRSGTLLAPIDEDGENAIKSLSNEESYSVTISVDRSLKMNGAYFSLLNFVWDNMPEKFQAKVPKNKFYVLLKELQCRFTEIKVSEKTSILNFPSLYFTIETLVFCGTLAAPNTSILSFVMTKYNE